MEIQDMSAINGERLLRIAAVLAMTGLGRSTLYRLIQQGKFPKPIHPLGNGLTTGRWQGDPMLTARTVAAAMAGGAVLHKQFVDGEARRN